MTTGNAVLITGCSSGIGRATAALLGRGGQHNVYATARRLDSIADLERDGCRLLQLDVTDEGSMVAAVSAIESDHGSVSALVNNAGYGEYGPVEEVPMERVRAQFETNVFGLSRMCQLVLPAMRAAKHGRIVNISSMGGRFTFPIGGYYHASKYAVEALSDALRFEVRPFGVGVSLVEPGLIRTGFGAAAAETLGASDTPTGPYAAMRKTFDAAMAESYENKMMTASPEAVAAVIQKAIVANRPRARYVVTPAAKGLITMRRAMPDRIWDTFLRQQFRES